MQSLKIIITLIVLITLGIIVGSNLIPTMTVTLLNQPTIALPVGLWLAIAIGLGLLSSSIFQFLIFLDRRLLDRKIRQLQSRLKQDEDIFTYTSEPPKVNYRNAARGSTETPAAAEPPSQKKSIFSSYKANFADTFKSKPVTNRVIDDDDDWDAAPVSNSQLEWDDPAPQPRQQKSNSTSDKYATSQDRSYPASRQTFVRDVEPPRRDEVYDADFRLIQPPYKQPAAELEYLDRAEDYQDDDIDDVEDSDFSRSSAASRSENRDSSKNSENDEDWGFDFDEEDTPSQKSKPRNRKR